MEKYFPDIYDSIPNFKTVYKTYWPNDGEELVELSTSKIYELAKKFLAFGDTSDC
jgi:hypothetical protein